MNLLFFLGVLIPALVTIGLFVIFCYCYHKMRVRNEILYKKHDPHKIEKLRESGRNYEPPPPPPPPFKQMDMEFLSQAMNHNNNNIKNKSSDNYEESPEPTEGIDNPAMYRTNPDSGFSDLNQIHCNVDTTSNALVQRHESDALRPNSQASDDSDDSGFRSSRSGQYIHSASSSTGNGQDSLLGCHPSEAMPLFKPIKIHPNEAGQPLVSYVHRNSSKRKSHKQRKPILSSQHYNCPSESQHAVSSHHQQLMQMEHINSGAGSHYSPAHSVSFSTTGPVRQTHQISKSCNDVHGGRLHSIDSHGFPLTSIGNFGTTNCGSMCASQHGRTVNSLYSDGHFSQPSSIGYGSLLAPPSVPNCLDGYGVGDRGTMCTSSQIKMDQLNHFPPMDNRITLSNKVPVITGQHHIPGYNISQFSHIRPIQPDIGLPRKSDHPFDIPMQVSITQAMVHRPFTETLSGDASLFSVV